MCLLGDAHFWGMTARIIAQLTYNRYINAAISEREGNDMHELHHSTDLQVSSPPDIIPTRVLCVRHGGDAHLWPQQTMNRCLRDYAKANLLVSRIY